MNKHHYEKIQLFCMKNLLLETELFKLEEKGIDINHKKTIEKAEVVDVDFFEYDILLSARKMADFYVLYFALENSLRRLIHGRLSEKYGINWWETQVPPTVKNNVKDKKDKEKETPMSIRSEDPLSYTSFSELTSILNKNWSDFSDTIRSQNAMQQILGQFAQLRNVIAHSCDLHEDEIIRFKLLIKDWFRILT